MIGSKARPGACSGRSDAPRKIKQSRDNQISGDTVPRQKFSEKRVFPPPILLHLSTHHIMIRTPLAPISGNRLKGPDLQPSERGFLLRLNAGGSTPSKIFYAYRVSESTTRSTITLASQRVNQVLQPRTGRPKLLSIRDYRYLIRIVRVDPRIKYRELLEKTGLLYLKSTVYRAMKEYGLTNWLLKKRPLLTLEVVALRLAWCQVREAWIKD